MDLKSNFPDTTRECTRNLFKRCLVAAKNSMGTVDMSVWPAGCRRPRHSGSGRERYVKVSGKTVVQSKAFIKYDPFACRFCGQEMELMKIWHPKYGAIFDGLVDKKAVGGESEPEVTPEESRKKGKKKRFLMAEYDIDGIHRGIQLCF